MKEQGLYIFALSGPMQSGKGSVSEIIQGFFRGKGGIYLPSTSKEIEKSLAEGPEPIFNPTRKQKFEEGCRLQELYGEDYFVRKFISQAYDLHRNGETELCIIDALRREKEALTAKELGVPIIWVGRPLHPRFLAMQQSERADKITDWHEFVERNRVEFRELKTICRIAEIRISNTGSVNDLRNSLSKSLGFGQRQGEFES